MPYKLQTPEELDLSVEINGQIIPVTLDPATAAPAFQQLYNKLVNAQCRIKHGVTPEELADLNKICGDAIIDLMGLLFGADGGKKLIDAYHDNYTQLIYAIIPFIRDEVKPKLEAYVRNLKKSYRKSARRWW